MVRDKEEEEDDKDDEDEDDDNDDSSSPLDLASMLRLFLRVRGLRMSKQLRFLTS